MERRQCFFPSSWFPLYTPYLDVHRLLRRSKQQNCFIRQNNCPKSATEAVGLEYHERSQKVWPMLQYLYKFYKDIFVLSLTLARIPPFSIALEAVCYLHLDPISFIYPHPFINISLKYGQRKQFSLLHKRLFRLFNLSICDNSILWFNFILAFGIKHMPRTGILFSKIALKLLPDSLQIAHCKIFSFRLWFI